jgi:hypothetical protein
MDGYHSFSYKDIKRCDAPPHISRGNSYLGSKIVFMALDLSGFMSLLFTREPDNQNIWGKGFAEPENHSGNTFTVHNWQRIKG